MSEKLTPPPTRIISAGGARLEVTARGCIVPVGAECPAQFLSNIANTGKDGQGGQRQPIFSSNNGRFIGKKLA